MNVDVDEISDESLSFLGGWGVLVILAGTIFYDKRTISKISYRMSLIWSTGGEPSQNLEFNIDLSSK